MKWSMFGRSLSDCDKIDRTHSLSARRKFSQSSHGPKEDKDMFKASSGSPSSSKPRKIHIKKYLGAL